jgi:hypothetical protein
VNDIDVHIVSPDSISPWRPATDKEIESYVSGDNYPGTDRQRWWNASRDAPLTSEEQDDEDMLAEQTRREIEYDMRRL